MRIGVFGGAFDPPHRAHRVLAEAALAQFELDELCILPTGQAWHKSRTLTPAVHRLAMARAAFSDMPRVSVDPRETQRQGPSYTVDTLTELQTQRPGHTWFLFIGEDQAQAFTTWHRWQDILRMATVVVAQRHSNPAIETRTSPGWHNPGLNGMHQLDMPKLAISATDIRDALQRGEVPSEWLLPPVRDYIFQHQLYRTHHE